MKGKSLIVAVFIVIGALVSFFIWNKGNEQQFDVDYLGFFKVQDDQLVIQYGQQLLWLSSDGESQQQFDIKSTDLHAHGDYDFFSNGDLLIYHKSEPLSFIEGISQYLRLTKEAEINPVRQLGDDGFYRCKLISRSCSPFGINLPPLDRSFRIVIDKQNDTLYLNNTSSHQLYKISDQGIVLATSLGNFKFPNHLQFINNDLWIADTNHHRLVSLNTASDGFAEELSQFDTAPSLHHQWPHQFSFQDKYVWVNVADHTMSDGMLVQYDLTGKQINQAQSEHLTDPTTLIIWQNKLLVADFKSANIEQFTLQGESLGLFTVTQLSSFIHARERQIEAGKHLSLIGIAVFIFTLVAGLIGAWVLEKKQSLALFVPTAHGPSADVIVKAREAFEDKFTSVSIFWLDNLLMKKRSRHMHNIAMLILLILVASLAWFYVLFVQLNTIIMAIGMLIFTVGYHYIIQYVASIKLGVQEGKLITVVNGKTTITDFSDVFYNRLYLYAGEHAIPLGNKQQPIFANDQLNECVYLQLKPENRLSGVTLVNYLWQKKEPLFLGYTLLCIGMLSIAISELLL